MQRGYTPDEGPIKTRFWIIYGSVSGAHGFKHKTKESAVAEAKRRAADSGEFVYVLCSESVAVRGETPVTTFETK